MRVTPDCLDKNDPGIEWVLDFYCFRSVAGNIVLQH